MLESDCKILQLPNPPLQALSKGAGLPPAAESGTRDDLLRDERRAQREIPLARNENVAAVFRSLVVRLEIGSNSVVHLHRDRNLQCSCV